MLYTKHNYLNKEITHIVNTSIREYDMKSGGYTILKQCGEFTEDEIKFLDNLPKYERNVWIGKRIREKKELSSILMEGFEFARKSFFEANGIEDSKVLSIKKDAIFLINYPCNITHVEGFDFQLKNTYSSYYYLNDKEFYFKGRQKELDVKGISDEIVSEHREFFVQDLIDVFSIAEKGNTDFLIKFLRRYRDNYLNKRLEVQVYREFNTENSYRTTTSLGDGMIYLDTINQGSAINIGYNYIKYIIPLIGYYL